MLSANLYSQPTDQEDVGWILVEEMPKFNNGGITEFRIWVYENLEYPESALNDSISGEVYAMFMVDSTGTVIDVEIVRGVRRDLNEKVLRVIITSPKWVPGKQRGKNVGVRFTIPIEFDIRDPDFSIKLEELRRSKKKRRKRYH